MSRDAPVSWRPSLEAKLALAKLLEGGWKTGEVLNELVVRAAGDMSGGVRLEPQGPLSDLSTAPDKPSAEEPERYRLPTQNEMKRIRAASWSNLKQKKT